jgi:hypothetical protein
MLYLKPKFGLTIVRHAPEHALDFARSPARVKAPDFSKLTHYPSLARTRLRRAKRSVTKDEATEARPTAP